MVLSTETHPNRRIKPFSCLAMPLCLVPQAHLEGAFLCQDTLSSCLLWALHRSFCGGAISAPTESTDVLRCIKYLPFVGPPWKFPWRCHRRTYRAHLEAALLCQDTLSSCLLWGLHRSFCGGAISAPTESTYVLRCIKYLPTCGTPWKFPWKCHRRTYREHLYTQTGGSTFMPGYIK